MIDLEKSSVARIMKLHGGWTAFVGCVALPNLYFPPPQIIIKIGS